LQTLWKAGGVELILVDSGSPDDERSVVMEFVERHPDANLLYARTDERETIQAAWNRGIQLAKAPYLVFLGADETLYPEALEVLARELDADAGLDWVMGDSLVTSRDANGAFQSDVMLYDRTGATKDHAYLETTYLSWVAGMYRKSIHDRFGYYDQTFGAAGDTEFKGRVLPFIQVRFLPQTLGEFWNYPEERTTASPRAEIEDSRAWYLHRTPGGIRYAFENRPVEDIIQLLHNALGYRKCYAQHVSCDIEYALHLCNYLLNRRPGAVPYVALQADLAQMLADLRGLDFPRQLGPIALVRQILMARWRARRFEARHRKLLRNPNVSYRIFNDNRYEQHHWFWPVG
jgi:glycosyltransferase involved in cell wall biosynthesis